MKKIDSSSRSVIAALTFDRPEIFFEYFTKYCSLLENIKVEDHLDSPLIIKLTVNHTRKLQQLVLNIKLLAMQYYVLVLLLLKYKRIIQT